jgi:hypothetical protein
MTTPQPTDTDRIIEAHRDEARRTRRLLIRIFVGIPVAAAIVWGPLAAGVFTRHHASTTANGVIQLAPHPGVATFTMRGFLRAQVLDPDGEEACEGTSSDNPTADVSQGDGSPITIAGGDQVLVTDGSDNLAVGTLGDGSVDGGGLGDPGVCLFTVTVPNVPVGHDTYSVVVSSCTPFAVSQRSAHLPVELRFPSNCS